MVSTLINEHHGFMIQPAAQINKSNQEMDEDGNNPSLPLFSYYESHVSNSVTHVYISQNIGAPAVYVPLVQFFNSRAPGDVVHMHLNCYGGRLDAGIQIVTSILTTNATVVAHLDGVAYSMAAVMFLACDNHFVSPYGKLMLHTYSGGGGGGKAPDQRAGMAAIDETYARIVQDICIPFLTKREVKDMLENSRDLYFGHDEIVERLNPQPKKATKPARAKKPAPTEPVLLEEAVVPVTNGAESDIEGYVDGTAIHGSDELQ